MFFEILKIGFSVMFSTCKYVRYNVIKSNKIKPIFRLTKTIRVLMKDLTKMNKNQVIEIATTLQVENDALKGGVYVAPKSLNEAFSRCIETLKGNKNAIPTSTFTNLAKFLASMDADVIKENSLPSIDAVKLFAKAKSIIVLSDTSIEFTYKSSLAFTISLIDDAIEITFRNPLKDETESESESESAWA